MAGVAPPTSKWLYAAALSGLSSGIQKRYGFAPDGPNDRVLRSRGRLPQTTHRLLTRTPPPIGSAFGLGLYGAYPYYYDDYYPYYASDDYYERFAVVANEEMARSMKHQTALLLGIRSVTAALPSEARY
jgi:hypothetical protein